MMYATEVCYSVFFVLEKMRTIVEKKYSIESNIPEKSCVFFGV